MEWNWSKKFISLGCSAVVVFGYCCFHNTLNLYLFCFRFPLVCLGDLLVENLWWRYLVESCLNKQNACRMTSETNYLSADTIYIERPSFCDFRGFSLFSSGKVHHITFTDFIFNFFVAFSIVIERLVKCANFLKFLESPRVTRKFIINSQLFIGNACQCHDKIKWNCICQRHALISVYLNDRYNNIVIP